MLKKQVYISVISLVITTLTGIVAIPFLTRLMSPEEMGKFYYIIFIIGVLQIFDGLRPIITYELNKEGNDEALFFKHIRIINFGLIVITSLFASIGLFFFSTLTSLEISMICIALSFFLLMSVEWGILDTKNKVAFTSLSRSLGWMFTYTVFVIMAFFGIKVSLFIIPLIVMYMFLFILYRYKLRAMNVIVIKGGQSRLNIDLIVSIISQVYTNMKIQVVSSILLSMDKVIIPFFMGYTSFGFYAVQVDLASKGYVLTATMRRILFPYLAQEKYKDKISIFISLYIYAFITLFILFIVVSYYSKELITLYAGINYTDYAYVFSIVIFIFPINILGSFAIVILHIHGDFKEHYKIYRNAAIFSIVVFSFLIYSFGLEGAAAGILFSRTLDIYIFLKSIDKYICPIDKLTYVLLIGLYFGFIYFIVLQNFSICVSIFVIMSIFLLNIHRRVINAST